MSSERSTDDKKFCAITEQGDLGLGAEVLNGEDQKVLEEQTAEENK